MIGPKYRERNSHGYAGIDVSVKESSVCIVDAKGKTVREVKVASVDRRAKRTPLAGDRRLKGALTQF